MDFEFNVPLAFGDAPACIVYMPKGEHFINASIGGRQKVIVDRSCLEGLQRDLALKLTQNVRPVCYFDHKTGPASFIPSAFDYMDGVGVILEGEWTESGKKAVVGRDYGYFSPAFKLNMATCRPVGLEPNDIEVGSLVNDPAFESIARIAASKGAMEDFTVFELDIQEVSLDLKTGVSDVTVGAPEQLSLQDSIDKSKQLAEAMQDTALASTRSSSGDDTTGGIISGGIGGSTGATPDRKRPELPSVGPSVKLLQA